MFFLEALRSSDWATRLQQRAQSDCLLQMEGAKTQL